MFFLSDSLGLPPQWGLLLRERIFPLGGGGGGGCKFFL